MEDTHGIECRIGHRVANTRSKVFKYGPYNWAFVQWHAPARINHQKEFRNNRINRLSWNQFYIWNAKLRWLKAVWMSLLNPRSAVLIHLIKDRIHWKSKIHGSLSECLWRHLCHESIPISWRAWSIGSSPYLEKTGPAAGNAAGWRRNLELPIHGSSGWKLLKVSKMTTLLARNCNLGVLLLSGISVLPILCEFVTFPCSKVYVTWQLWRRTTSIQYTRTSSTPFSGAIRHLCCLDWNHQGGGNSSRYWLSRHHGCFSHHPTKKNQWQVCFFPPLCRCIFQSYLFTHQNVFQCFRTAWDHSLGLVCDSHNCLCHLGAYCLDVGRDAYTSIHRYVQKEMHAFLHNFLALLFIKEKISSLWKQKSWEP